MNNQSSGNREFLIPLLIGGLSVLGIIAVLMVGRALSAPAQVAATPSATPFEFIYLGTEPGIATLVVEGTEPPATQAPIEETSDFVTPFRPTTSVPTLIILASATRTAGAASATATRTSTPSTANTFDDTDSRLTYTGSWVSQTGVSGAYQDSLHISYTVGNSVRFSFTGTELHVFYQAGPSLGTMTITIDSFGDPPISQAQNTTQIKEWVSQPLSNVTHVVDIQHAGGGSINIDRIYIPSSTPTPTRTPTATP